MTLYQQEVNKKVCEEAPVDLIVNGRKVLTFMCTPEDLNYLAVGHLFTRGLITSLDEIKDLGVSEEIRKVIATTRNLLSVERYGLSGVLTSGCGSGTVISDAFLKEKAIETQLKMPIEQLKELTVQMFKGAVKHMETGGHHCAALADQSRILILKEDIGRHNAVDKVIGQGLLEKIDFSQSILITTGRISSDMLLKAVASRIPIVVSRSIPTSLALEIGERLGISIIGRVVSKEPVVYCHQERIISEACHGSSEEVNPCLEG